MRKAIALLIIAISAIAVKAQSDSIGIYSVRDRIVKRMEIIKHNQTRISGALVVYKTKLVYDGATSENHFKGTAHFRIYFSQPHYTLLAKYYMFTPNFSIKDFAVGKLEAKKGSRQLSVGLTNLAGGYVGAKKAENVNVKTTQLREGVYEIEVSGPPGEYCIMQVTNGVGGYNGIFDFTIE